MALSSMTESASMTSSASATSLVPKARVALSMATVTSSAISTRRPWTSSSDWWNTSRMAAPFLCTGDVRDDPRRHPPETLVIVVSEG
jgi:hypothetical protein